MTVLIFKLFAITLSMDVIHIWLSSETKNVHFRIQKLTQTVLECLISVQNQWESSRLFIFNGANTANQPKSKPKPTKQLNSLQYEVICLPDAGKNGRLSLT